MENELMPRVVAIIESARGKTSVRKAAKLAGMSEGRWRQIAKGYQSVGGVRVPVSTPPETLARMAAAVGVEEPAVRAVGASEVADELRTITTRTRGVGIVLDADRYGEAVVALRAWLEEEGDDGPIHPPAEVLWLWSPLQLSLVLAEQVEALEAAFTETSRAHFQEVMKRKRTPDYNTETEQADARTTSTKTAERASADSAEAAEDAKVDFLIVSEGRAQMIAQLKGPRDGPVTERRARSAPSELLTGATTPDEAAQARPGRP